MNVCLCGEFWIYNYYRQAFGVDCIVYFLSQGSTIFRF